MNAPPLFGLIPMPTNIEDLPDPENGPYYVATQTGYMIMDTNHFGRYLVKVEKNEFLSNPLETIWYDIPKMPDWIIGQAWSFFRAIYQSMQSEAMLDITYSDAKGYRLFVPPQKATGGGVTCERVPEHYKGRMVGTIHSHCMMPAFHSSTDTHDASTHDGLHITIGRVMDEKPQIAIMIAKNKKTWSFELENVQDEPLTLYDHPKWWEAYVQKPNSVFKKNEIQTYLPATSYTSQYKSKNGVIGVGEKTNNPKKFVSLDELIRSGTKQDAEAVGILLDIEHEVDQISTMLLQFGIHFDYDFQTMPSGLVIPKELGADDDDDIPAIWRYMT